jgi:hypothetical protein
MFVVDRADPGCHRKPGYVRAQREKPDPAPRRTCVRTCGADQALVRSARGCQLVLVGTWLRFSDCSTLLETSAWLPCSAGVDETIIYSHGAGRTLREGTCFRAISFAAGQTDQDSSPRMAAACVPNAVYDRLVCRTPRTQGRDAVSEHGACTSSRHSQPAKLPARSNSVSRWPAAAEVHKQHEWLPLSLHLTLTFVFSPTSDRFRFALPHSSLPHFFSLPDLPLFSSSPCVSLPSPLSSSRLRPLPLLRLCKLCLRCSGRPSFAYCRRSSTASTAYLAKCTMPTTTELRDQACKTYPNSHLCNRLQNHTASVTASAGTSLRHCVLRAAVEPPCSSPPRAQAQRGRRRGRCQLDLLDPPGDLPGGRQRHFGFLREPQGPRLQAKVHDAEHEPAPRRGLQAVPELAPVPPPPEQDRCVLRQDVSSGGVTLTLCSASGSVKRHRLAPSGRHRCRHHGRRNRLHCLQRALLGR